MEHSQPGRMWLDILPTPIKSSIVKHATGGQPRGQAVNLAKLGFAWAVLVWSAVEGASVVTLRLEQNTDEELEVQGQYSTETLAAHDKLVALITCFANRETDDFLFQEVCVRCPQVASMVLRELKVKSVHIPLQKNMMNNVLASSFIEELYLTMRNSTMHQILEDVEEIPRMFQRLASLHLKTLCMDGELENCFRDMDIPAALASGFSVFASEGSSSCQLIWSIRLQEFVWGDASNKFENFWKTIDLLPAATSVVLFHPPPERLLEKLSSFAALDIRTPLFSSTTVSRLGSVVKGYKGEFRSCLKPRTEGCIELRSLQACTQLKKLHVTGCWHMLADLATIIKNMDSMIRLVLEVIAKNPDRRWCNACGIQPDYLSRTAQFLECISHIAEVDFIGCDITIPDLKQVLKLLGTKIRCLHLRGTFDSHDDMLDYDEALLISLLACKLDIHSIVTRFVYKRTVHGRCSLQDELAYEHSFDPVLFESLKEWLPYEPTFSSGLSSQERRISMLKDKLHRKHPLLHYEKYATGILLSSHFYPKLLGFSYEGSRGNFEFLDKASLGYS